MFDAYHLMNIVLGILIFLIMIFIKKKQGLLEKYIDALPTVNGANKCSDSHDRKSSGTTHYHGMCPCPDGHESDGSTGCKLCSAGTAGTGGTCSPCGNNTYQNEEGKESCTTCGHGQQPNSQKTACNVCPEGTAGRDGRCSPCTGRTYAVNAAQQQCTPIVRNVNVSPDECYTMVTQTQNGGNYYEISKNKTRRSVADWGSCCTESDCANKDHECVSFDNLPKRCLNDGMMKRWCGSQPNYKGDKYWDNTNQTWRCYTKDCDERNDENCTTLRDINNNPEVRCKYNTCSNGRCRDCVNK